MRPDLVVEVIYPYGYRESFSAVRQVLNRYIKVKFQVLGKIDLQLVPGNMTVRCKRERREVDHRLVFENGIRKTPSLVDVNIIKVPLFQVSDILLVIQPTKAKPAVQIRCVFYRNTHGLKIPLLNAGRTPNRHP